MKPLLTAQEAAEEYGLENARKFLRAVDRGEMPPPHTRSRPRLWARVMIDRYLAGDRQHDKPSDEPDELMEHINALGENEIRGGMRERVVARCRDEINRTKKKP